MDAVRFAAARWGPHGPAVLAARGRRRDRRACPGVLSAGAAGAVDGKVRHSSIKREPVVAAVGGVSPGEVAAVGTPLVPPVHGDTVPEVTFGKRLLHEGSNGSGLLGGADGASLGLGGGHGAE